MFLFHISSAILALTGVSLLMTGLIRNVLLNKNLTPGNDRMQTIASYIRIGAYAFLYRQYHTVAIIALIIIAILYLVFGVYMAYGFAIGVLFSSLAGVLGMIVAVYGNVLIAAQACSGSNARANAAKTSVSFGSIISFIVVGLGLLALFAAISIPVYSILWTNQMLNLDVYNLSVLGDLLYQPLVHSTLGLAIGSSLVSIFGRVAGGIFTKAADIGADLVGKLENGLDEDDPRNPAVIADNVGDNVGDCAGMAADVFETFVVSLVAISQIIFPKYFFQMNPVLAEAIAKIGVYVLAIICMTSLIGAVSTFCFCLKPRQTVVNSLYMIMTYTVAVSSVAILGLTYWIFNGFTAISLRHFAYRFTYKAPLLANSLTLAACVLLGFALTIAVILITTYYTDSSYRPVKSIAQASNNGHATNIIYGLSVGMESTFATMSAVVVVFFACYHLAGLLGIMLSVVAMIALTIIIMTLDAYGPMTDNAGGIAEMSDLDNTARTVTDELDAAGNTTKAITKGYAISAAALCSTVLTVAFMMDIDKHMWLELCIANPFILMGLLIGGMIPYIFSALNMKSVGILGGQVVEHVREQFRQHPEILTDRNIVPDYRYTVDFLTKSSIKAMLIPALIPVVIPVTLFLLFGFGVDSKIIPIFAGLNTGVLISGAFLGLTLTNAGGAWDNAKKYIEQGNHGGKRSPAHAAAITGDTVGDPCKDTAGPAINPLIKVVNLITILLVLAYKMCV